MSNQDLYDLDFTALMDPQRSVPEPAPPTPERARELSEEAVIGESKLTSNGFFVRLFPDAPRRMPSGSVPLILVVEDDDTTASILARVLEKESYRVQRASNRGEIVEGMKSRPDLVLLDVLLPDANGFDILNRIRSSDNLKMLPVLMLTSLGSLDDILKGLKLGANGYLTKPAKSKALLNAIQEVIFK